MLSFHIAPGFIGSLHLATCGIQASIPCHNGSRICIFLPLRMPWNRPIPAGDTSWTASLLRPSPQRQRIPHFPAVADVYSSMKRSSDAWNMTKMYNDNDNN